jgi:hypothetical protein
MFVFKATTYLFLKANKSILSIKYFQFLYLLVFVFMNNVPF